VLVLLAPWFHGALDVYRMGAAWIPRVTLMQALLAQSVNLPLLVLWIALAIVAAHVGLRRNAPAISLAASVWLVPLLIPVVLSTLDRPMFVPRYAIVALIGIHALCGYAAAVVGQQYRWFGASLGGAVVAAGLWTSIPLLVTGATVLDRPDVRTAARHIDQHARGDGVCPSTVYYWPAFDRYAARRDLLRLDSLSQLRELPETPLTLWMIVDDDVPDPVLEGYTVVETRPMQGLKLLRAQRTAPVKPE
jgi:hypothetical protein